MGGYWGDEVNWADILARLFNMESSKRRLLIKTITKGLEKVLRVDNDKYATEIEGVTQPPRPYETEDLEQEFEEVAKEIKFILKVSPRFIRERYVLSPAAKRLRELATRIDIARLPRETQDDLFKLGIIN